MSRREEETLCTEVTSDPAGPFTISVRVRKSLPDFHKSISLKYVKRGYHHLITHAVYLVMIPVLVLLATADITSLTSLGKDDILCLWEQYSLFSVLISSGALVTTVYIMSRRCAVYLVDFACYKPDDSLQVTREKFMTHSRLSGNFDERNLQFQKRIVERSGVGEKTYLPRAIHALPAYPNIQEARLEAEQVMFGALDELFAKTGVKPRDIGILVVNCSLFTPTPSLSAMIINHYKLRGNVKSLNLGGMGCSAGLIAIDLARDLLQVHRNSYAVVVSTENITLNWYTGNNRSMLVSNCLFRMGGAAILLSNKRKDRRKSKYQLLHTVRTHKGADDRSYRCAFQEEDENKKIGVSLTKDLMEIAGEALKANITTLGPLVLPLSEQLIFLSTLICRKVFKMKVKPYIPDFKLAFEHFCIHAGGRAVLDELEKNLDLSEWHMEPSRMTLYSSGKYPYNNSEIVVHHKMDCDHVIWFGNTSSSSLWYELAYTEAKGRVTRGDRVWQIAFGSGFKCNSAVWKSLRNIKRPQKSPWADCIDNFPIEIPESKSL